MPAILTEVGFISHPATEARLATEDYRALLARAIASVLADYGSARKPRA
jgi:N-acetylmuramoyl-L-alanine amidase